MILASSKSAPQNRPDHDTPAIRVFQLKRQNRKHEHVALNVDIVRQRVSPVEVKGKKRRQISATLPPFTTSITTSGTSASTGTAQPSPAVTVTEVIVPSVTDIASGTQTFIISAVTVTEVVIPSSSVTVIVSGSQTFTLSAGVSFPEQSMPPTPPPSSGGTTVLPGPGSASTVTVIQPNHTLSGTIFPTFTATPAAVNPPPAPHTRRRVSTIAGAVVGTTVALLLIVFVIFCYRRRHQNRVTGPVLLADPFQDEVSAPPNEEQRVAADITTPSPFRGDELSASQSQLSSSALPAKRAKQADAHGRDASISTSHSPLASADDSLVTMADLNILRARILEVENLALRQRIADVENIAQAGPSASNATTNAVSITSSQPPRASESPPEYASPLVEAPGDSRA